MAISRTFSANYAILQLCRVAANHVAQFSNGSCLIRASDFCNENLGDYFCDYPPPFAWPFMQKSARLGLGAAIIKDRVRLRTQRLTVLDVTRQHSAMCPA